MAKSDDKNDKKVDSEELKDSDNQQDNPVAPDSGDSAILNDPAVQDPYADGCDEGQTLDAAQFIDPNEDHAPTHQANLSTAHQGDHVQTPAGIAEAQGGPSQRVTEEEKEAAEKGTEQSSSSIDLSNIKTGQAGQFVGKQAGEEASSQTSTTSGAASTNVNEGDEASSDGASAIAASDDAARRGGDTQPTASEGSVSEPNELTEQVLATNLDGEEEFLGPEGEGFDEGFFDDPSFDGPFVDDFSNDPPNDFFADEGDGFTFIPETELPPDVVDPETTTPDLQLNAPDVFVENISLNENSTASLSITVDSNSQNITEALEVRISGVPDGVSLSEGSYSSGGGYWSLSIDEAQDVTIGLPEHSNLDFTLNVTAVATDVDTDETASKQANVNVDVIGVADQPSLTVTPASGSEDNAINLVIDSELIDTDGSESLSIEISGVPDGATLSAGTLNTGGSYTLTVEQLDGLKITPAENSEENIELTITATATENDGNSSSISKILSVNISDVADTPSVTVSSATGADDTTIELGDIVVSANAADSSVDLTTTVSDIPVGATLSDGDGNSFSATNGNTSIDVSDWDLTGMTITPPANSEADIALTVSTSTQDESGDPASASEVLNVTVTGVADTPTVAITNASGNEDTAISLDISGTLTDTDSSESLSYEVSDIPIGAVLSDSNGNTFTATGGNTSVILSDWDMNNLTITPPSNSGDDFTLQVTATATEDDGDTASSTVANLVVDVTPVADAPIVDITNTASGGENSAIALTIDVELQDTDGSEDAYALISDVPSGATLSEGTDLGSGTWLVTQAQLDGLTITPAIDSSDDFTLQIEAYSEESENGDTSSVTGSIDVTINALDDTADTPSISEEGVSGIEDTAIDLDVSAALTDIDGAELTDGTNTFTASSGNTSVDTSAWALDSLQVTAPDDSNEDFTLTLEATSTETSRGDTNTVSTNFDVSVTGDADAPTLSVDDFSAESGETVAFDISSVLTDTDSSESLSITVDGVPDFATLSAGTDNGDGSWSLSSDDLDGLTITTTTDGGGDGGDGDDSDGDDGDGSSEQNIDGDYDLTITATSTENDGDSESVSEMITLSVGTGDDTSGSNSGNTYSGTAYDDTYDGKKGDDTISGLGGDDTLLGDKGNDTIFGGTGDDTIYGESDHDTLFGDEGNDTIYGGKGNDELTGGSGDDTLIGGNDSGTFTYSELSFGIDNVYGNNDCGKANTKWTDEIDISNISGGDTYDSSDYTTDGSSLTFNDPNASGALTFDDGSQVNFHETEKIDWQCFKGKFL